MVPAATVALVLEAFRPYGPHVHTMAEHAQYFLVSRRTVCRWLNSGFPLGLYGSPGRQAWAHAADMAIAYYGLQRELAITHHTWLRGQ